jgi:hypothetical protein
MHAHIGPLTRPILILLGGIAMGLLACVVTYRTFTAPHRAMLQHELPELAWLQREFNLAPDEFERISALHRAYLPHCEELCERIAAQHDKIRRLVVQSAEVTPEILRLLEEAARIRLECQRVMLDHFFAVSRAMPPDQGKRYLAWVQEKTFHMDHDPGSPASSHSGHGHREHPHH